MESVKRTVNGKERRFQNKTPISYILAPEADGETGGGSTGGNTGGDTGGDEPIPGGGGSGDEPIPGGGS